MLLQVRGLSKSFSGLVAVNGVDLEVSEGELLAIVGPNGAGKTVLFALISGLMKATGGQVVFRGEDITGLKPHLIARKGIGRTFQTTALFDQLRVVDNLALGYRMRTSSGVFSTLLRTAKWKRDTEMTMSRISEVLEIVGLREKAFHFASTLTQAEQRKLAIGIALMGYPKLLLLDEPTGGLIEEDTKEISRLIKRLHRELNVTICLIEHKMRMVMELAQRIVVLNFGSIIAQGPPEKIASDPRVVEAYLGVNHLADSE